VLIFLINQYFSRAALIDNSSSSEEDEAVDEAALTKDGMIKIKSCAAIYANNGQLNFL
jgi:N-acetylglutamate synthase-like GNAT family acetyltransferase